MSKIVGHQFRKKHSRDKSPTPLLVRACISRGTQPSPRVFGPLQTVDSVIYFKALKRRPKIGIAMDIQKEIDNISSQIVAKYKPEKVILFGSAVLGKATPESDLDFLIIKKDTPHFGEDRIRELSVLIDRRVPVDFVIYRPDEFEQRLRMGDPFLKAILKEGKVLHG